MFPGHEYTYLSSDTCIDSSDGNLYPPKLLNSLTLSGMPPHSLKLKLFQPVTLLRNINQNGKVKFRIRIGSPTQSTPRQNKTIFNLKLDQIDFHKFEFHIFCIRAL